jgi:hypothetical protein
VTAAFEAPAGGAVWVAQDGAQKLFLSCPVFEVLVEGTRGGGKTDMLLMDFAQHCGVGFAESWRGVLFRQTYPQLADVIAKSKKWFPRVFPGVAFNEQKTTWTWPGGEQLLFRHMASPDDYWSYHGHEYPWIGWEELTNWADDKCYLRMMSCCRSSHPGVPRKLRATTNPYGRGHNWVKARYQLPHMRLRVVRQPGGKDRVAIPSYLHENRVLLAADPKYLETVAASARNPAERKAWTRGSWDIVAGGMFDDLWDARVHVLPRFDPPRGWRVDRSFDWGSSKPFSVGWWAVSNGEDLALPDGRTLHTVRGDLFRIAEWYGWNGVPNEGVRMGAADVARGILDREADLGLTGRVRPGPADSSIYDSDNGPSVAEDMRVAGVTWQKADKGPGSRAQGWLQLRKLLKGALPPAGGGPRETPGLFVTEACVNFLRTIPTLPRDDSNLDDVDTAAEDHIADEARYRSRWKPKTMKQGNF